MTEFFLFYRAVGKVEQIIHIPTKYGSKGVQIVRKSTYCFGPGTGRGVMGHLQIGDSPRNLWSGPLPHRRPSVSSAIPADVIRHQSTAQGVWKITFPFPVVAFDFGTWRNQDRCSRVRTRSFFPHLLMNLPLDLLRLIVRLFQYRCHGLSPNLYWFKTGILQPSMVTTVAIRPPRWDCRASLARQTLSLAVASMPLRTLLPQLPSIPKWPLQQS